MRWTARSAGVLAAGLVLAAAAALAEDSSQGSRYYESRVAKLEKAAAARLWDAAAKARSASLFRFAREEARKVLEFDPDNLQARQFLCYVKRGEVWEPDLALSGRLPTENQQPPVGPKLADAENAWRAVAAKAELDVAAMYAQLGDECAAKGFRGEATQAYAKTLSMDRDNEAAHKGLGHFELAEGLWVSDEARRAFDAARAARPIVVPDRYDELFGETYSKAESGHVRVESPNPQTTIEGYLDASERAYAAYLGDLGLDPDRTVFPRKPVFLVIESLDQWDRWVNRMVGPERQGFFRPLTSQWSRDERWACALRRHDGDNDAKRRDRLAHQTVHMMNFALWDMPSGCWLDDALAYRYPYMIQGTTYAFCLQPRKGDYALPGQDRDWMAPEQWKPLLREFAAKRDDPALRLIVNKSAWELPLLCSVKAWSVVDFLIRRDRAAFAQMLKELKGEKDLVGLLETRFGKDVESLDEDWRRWVIATY